MRPAAAGARSGAGVAGNVQSVADSVPRISKRRVVRPSCESAPAVNSLPALTPPTPFDSRGSIGAVPPRTRWLTTVGVGPGEYMANTDERAQRSAGPRGVSLFGTSASPDADGVVILDTVSNVGFVHRFPACCAESDRPQRNRPTT
jgi:hypothetical protein